MGSSISKKILFSFLFITFLGILGNLLLVIKFSNVELSTKGVLEVQSGMGVVGEMETNLNHQRKLVGLFRNKPDSTTYNSFIETTQNFSENVGKIKLQWYWKDESVRDALNNLVYKHNNFISKFNSGAYLKDYFRQQRYIDELYGTLDALQLGFWSLRTGLADVQQGKLDEVSLATEFMNKWVLILTFITGFLSILFCIYITRGILSPLRKLLVGTRLIGQGHYDNVIEVNQGDTEVLELIDAYQEMVKQIKKFQKRLVEKERLKAVSAIATGVTHEVNNPLMIISGTAEFLRTVKGESDPDIKEKMDTIIQEIGRISAITQKLSRIKTLIVEDYSMEGESDSGKGRMVNIENSAKANKP